jgi:hypothetical protein
MIIVEKYFQKNVKYKTKKNGKIKINLLHI